MGGCGEGGEPTGLAGAEQGGSGGEGGDAGGSSDAGSAGAGGEGPEPECAAGATETKACGLNGAGTSERHCDAGKWSSFDACNDPHDCVNGDQQNRLCGLNDSGVEVRTCNNGHFGAWGACSSVDVCSNGEVETTACGFNGNGEKQRTCQNGAWPAFGECYDPDQCANGATESLACGRNGRGNNTRTCVAGAWSDYADCADPDVCFDEDEQAQLCGLNNNGYQSRKCTAGQWPSWPVCNDPDECVNGAAKKEACGPANAAERIHTCTAGDWQPGVCAYPAGPCAGDVTIPDQATFDLYSRCTSVAGNLSFVANKNMQTTLSMPLLGSVGGSIEIDGYAIRSVAFPALTSLGTDILVHDSPYVFDISAPLLEVIPGDFVITGISGSNNTSLMNGLGELKQVGGDLKVYDNLDLTTLSLPSLGQVGGDLWLGDDANCRGNRIKSLDGLSSLQSVGGSLVVAGNIWLEDIAGLSNLKTVGQDLIVRYNMRVADLSPLSQIKHVPGNLMVGHIVGPTVYNFSYGVEIRQTSLHGLHHVEYVGGDLTIGDVDIPDLDDLDALTEVGGALTLAGTGPDLEVLQAPPQLQSLGGLIFADTDALAYLTAIDFDVATITGDVLIADGFRLTKIEFPTLQELSGVLRIERMESYLGNMQQPNQIAFPELKHAGGIELPNLGVLQQLSSFPELTSVDGDVWLSGFGSGQVANQSIVDFNELTSIGGSLTLYLPGVVELDAFAKLQSVGDVSLTSVPPGTNSLYYNHLLRPSARTFQALTQATTLTVGGFSNFEPCWAQDLAEQIWPDGGAKTDFWGLPVCVP